MSPGTEQRKEIPVRALLLFISFVLSLCGCESLRSHQLSKSEVIKIAERVGAEHAENMQEYRSPRLLFVARTGEWIVCFVHKTPYIPSGEPRPYHFFSVYLDDKTGIARYSEGHLE
jgi:hypothetical protein